MKEDDSLFAVVTFHSTYSVLKTEKILKDAGLEKVRLVPVPSEISSDCGVTVRFLLDDLERVLPLLQPVDEDLEGIFTSTEEGWVPAAGTGG